MLAEFQETTPNWGVPGNSASMALQPHNKPGNLGLPQFTLTFSVWYDYAHIRCALQRCEIHCEFSLFTAALNHVFTAALMLKHRHIP